MILGVRPCTTFSLCRQLSVDGCCATGSVLYRLAVLISKSWVLFGGRAWARGHRCRGGFCSWQLLQCQYNTCWQGFSEVSEFQVITHTHTRAVAPFPRPPLEVLCRLMRQRSLGLWLGFVCSFPTFLQVILLLGLLCI